MDKLNKLSEEISINNQDKISVCIKVNETKQKIIAINLPNVLMVYSPIYILQIPQLFYYRVELSIL